jgi:dynein heavy chain
LSPKTEFESRLNKELLRAVTKDVPDRHLIVVEPVVIKTLQLHETMVIRHGGMLVGPTCGGKSTPFRTLAKVINVNVMSLNPKSIKLPTMYGSFKETTGEWFTGIVLKMFRECVTADDPHDQWIVFHGPVDALWIENMNTVLDDNKMLSPLQYLLRVLK